MSRGDLPQITIPIALLLTELFQRFFSELAKISNLHGSISYNRLDEMSRKIIPGVKWGKVLRKLREDAHLNQTDIAEAIGYKGDAKGNVSEIEQGKLPIDEQKVRLWVIKCGKTMFEFYVLATRLEGGFSLLETFQFPKKSN